MQIRDAREGDESAIAALADGDIDPRHLIRERIVRVATDPSESAGEDTAGDAIAGFCAFDARPEAVHVTRVGGDEDAIRLLLDDAIRYADRENLPVEAVVPVGGSTAVALETRGFEGVGSGPRFEGQETTRFRLDPT